MESNQQRGVIEYSRDVLRSIYERMLTIRLCEESMVEPILNGAIRCPCHLYSGQEAIAVGMCHFLDARDSVFSNHRSHGHYLAMEGDVYGLYSEIYGAADGCAKGRGGSMHLISPENGILGAAPIVAGTISLAVGAALAFQIRNEPCVAVTFFGDGATTEGVLMEAMNFAALRQLPVVFVCENNFYATHMPVRDIRPDVDIYRIAEPFGIETRQVDGNNVLAVMETAREAVDLCRRGRGPFFMEAQTYRMRGHVGPDDNIQGVHTDIRAPAEVEAWKAKDPIPRFGQYLVDTNQFDESELESIRNEVRERIDAVQKRGCQAAKPNGSELAHNVFK